MEYRKLGHSGLLVSELALGTMVFGENSERSTPPEMKKPIFDRFFVALENHDQPISRPLFLWFLEKIWKSGIITGIILFRKEELLQQ